MPEPLTLVRGDDPWSVDIVLWDDAALTVPHDLTDETVTAELRWRGGEQAVTADITAAAAGEVSLSLAGADTLDLPLGRLATLYVAVETETWAALTVEIREGIVG